MASSALDDASRASLAAFLGVQRTRARLYAELQAGFKNLTGSQNEGMYRTLLARLSAGFSDCSRQVIEIEARLKGDLNRPDLAALLRTVQENEREKLKCTLSLHALKGTYANGTFSWQQQDSQSQRDAAGAVFDQAQDNAHQHDAHGHHHHHHGAGQCGCGGPAPPPEPTEAEYRGAVQEALLLQNEAIEAINEVLEEVNALVNSDEE